MNYMYAGCILMLMQGSIFSSPVEFFASPALIFSAFIVSCSHHGFNMVDLLIN